MSQDPILVNIGLTEVTLQAAISHPGDPAQLPQGLDSSSSPTFAGLTLSGLAPVAPVVSSLVLVGANGQITTVLIGTNLSIVNGALVATGAGGEGGGYSSLTMPTGFAVTGSGSASIAVNFATGYSLPTNAAQESWTAGATLAASSVQQDDARLIDARPWNASLMSEAEARAGSATTARQTTAQRLRQAAEGWWDAVASLIGKALSTAASQSEARLAIGAEAAGAAAAAQAAAVQRINHTGEQAISTVTGLSTALQGKADLVEGVIPSSQIPAIAITQYLGTVSTEAAMLALAGQSGDWCIRTDGANAGAWVLFGEPSSTLANWVKVPMPAVPVQSVNGQVGLVTLGAADVGAPSTTDPRLVDAREWSAVTISQMDAENGTATTRVAFTAQRVFQAIAAWWATSSAKTKLDGIASGATNTPLSSSTPQALGTAAAGTGSSAARGDHVHPPPPVVTSSAAGLVPSAGMPGGDRLFFWDDSAGAYTYATIGPGVVMDGTTLRAEESPWLALGDETTAATTGVKLTERSWPQAHRLTAIPLWSASAPVGSALQLDIQVGGTSIFSTLPTIAVGGTSSAATTPAVFSTAFVSAGQTIAAGSTVTFHVIQAPSGGGGAGLKVQMHAVRV